MPINKAGGSQTPTPMQHIHQAEILARSYGPLLGDASDLLDEYQDLSTYFGLRPSEGPQVQPCRPGQRPVRPRPAGLVTLESGHIYSRLLMLGDTAESPIKMTQALASANNGLDLETALQLLVRHACSQSIIRQLPKQVDDKVADGAMRLMASAALRHRAYLRLNNLHDDPRNKVLLQWLARLAEDGPAFFGQARVSTTSDMYRNEGLLALMLHDEQASETFFASTAQRPQRPHGAIKIAVDASLAQVAQSIELQTYLWAFELHHLLRSKLYRPTDPLSVRMVELWAKHRIPLFAAFGEPVGEYLIAMAQLSAADREDAGALRAILQWTPKRQDQSRQSVARTTFLATVVERGWIDGTRALIEAGYDLNRPHPALFVATPALYVGPTAFHLAVENRLGHSSADNQAMLSLLLEAGADPRAVCVRPSAVEGIPLLEDPVETALCKKDVAQVQRLLRAQGEARVKLQAQDDARLTQAARSLASAVTDLRGLKAQKQQSTLLLSALQAIVDVITLDPQINTAACVQNMLSCLGLGAKLIPSPPDLHVSMAHPGATHRKNAALIDVIYKSISQHGPHPDIGIWIDSAQNVIEDIASLESFKGRQKAYKTGQQSVVSCITNSSDNFSLQTEHVEQWLGNLARNSVLDKTLVTTHLLLRHKEFGAQTLVDKPAPMSLQDRCCAFALGLRHQRRKDLSAQSRALWQKALRVLLITPSQIEMAAMLQVSIILQDSPSVQRITELARNAKFTLFTAPHIKQRNILHLAASGSLDVLRTVLGTLPKAQLVLWLMAQDDHGDTPIHLAARLGRRQVSPLLEAAPKARGELLAQINVSGRTPPLEALIYGHTQTFTQLTGAGVSSHTSLALADALASTSPVNFSAVLSDLAQADASRATVKKAAPELLLKFARQGDYSGLKAVLAQFPRSIEATQDRQETILHALARNDDAATLDRLRLWTDKTKLQRLAHVKDQQGRFAESLASTQPVAMRLKKLRDPFGHATKPVLVAWHEPLVQSVGQIRSATTSALREQAVQAFLQATDNMRAFGATATNIETAAWQVIELLSRPEQDGPGMGVHFSAHRPNQTLTELKQRAIDAHLLRSSCFAHADGLALLRARQKALCWAAQANSEFCTLAPLDVEDPGFAGIGLRRRSLDTQDGWEHVQHIRVVRFVMAVTTRRIKIISAFPLMR